MKIEFYCDMLNNVCMIKLLEDEILNICNIKS